LTERKDVTMANFDPKRPELTVVVIKNSAGKELARVNAANTNRLHQLMVTYAGQGPLTVEHEDDPLLGMLGGMFGGA